MADDLFHVTTELADRFGPLTAPTVKPYSASLRTADQKQIIKVYRGIEPLARQQREIEALHVAPTLGIAVPRILDHGDAGAQAWTAFEVVPGCPGKATDDRHWSRVRPVMAALHRFASADGAGPGWTVRSAGGLSNSAHLIRQVSARVQAALWWPRLAEQLRELDDQPTVYLHGDLKPDHLISANSGTWIVDWEACARGPAACDHADAIFHQLRDLIYSGRPVDTLTAPTVGPPGLPIVLAWRLVLWADRRRPEDLGHLPADGLTELTQEPPAAAIRIAARIIFEMRHRGTPR